MNHCGDVVRGKAHVVAKGLSQKNEVSYFQIFSPTPANSSNRLVVCTALNNELGLFHFDADQAFVQSDLDTDMCMKVPHGYDELIGKIIKLSKSLCGLNQTAHSWHEHLVTCLQRNDFEQYDCEPCLLRLINKVTDEVRIMLVVHVGHMMVTESGIICERLRYIISKALLANTLGPLTWYTACAFE